MNYIQNYRISSNSVYAPKFGASNPVTENEAQPQSKEQEVKSLSNVTPDYGVKAPMSYTKTGELKISDDDIRKICMLVVYHDIVGDCICKGRDKEQISKIISNGNDLDLLITIALADTKTINTTWYQNILYTRKGFKEDILHMLGLLHG